MKPVTFDVKDPKTGKIKHCVALIRKLTERECFRLMAVPEDDITKIANSGVSRSAQYKLAGNSIVAGTGRLDRGGITMGYCSTYSANFSLTPMRRAVR